MSHARHALTAAMASVAGLVGLGYIVALLLISLRSVERTLPPGEVLRFCGLYLDCHLSASVLGMTSGARPDGGYRYTVRLRVANDARAATLRFTNPTARLLDGTGRSIPAAQGPRSLTLAKRTGQTVEFVFDAEAPLVRPRLLLRKGGALERLSELLLIGDPDSFLHAPVTLALRAS